MELTKLKCNKVLTFLVFLFIYSPLFANESFCPNGINPDPNVIWCDSFEDDLPLSDKYYDYNSDGDEFIPVTYETIHGSKALRALWQPGEINAGALMLNFGRSPLPSEVHSTRDFKEIYWRVYRKLPADFVGWPSKLTRATIFAGVNWEQAMIGHIWANEADKSYLDIDPASGIDNDSNLITTKWNDFDNLIWLGLARGDTPTIKGNWECIEGHIKLNSAGLSDGLFEYWKDGVLQASKGNINWIKSWNEYGLNAITLETYWGDGSPVSQVQYYDAFVISETKIGCINDIRPKPPVDLIVD